MTAGRADVQLREQSLLAHHDVVVFLKNQGHLGYSLGIDPNNNDLVTPVLSFRSILARSPNVFQIVEYGSPFELYNLLDDSSVSVTDCDNG